MNSKTIICFGNSLTAGYGLKQEESYPSLLQKRLNDQGLKYKVINAGNSGETTEGGLYRIDWVLQQKPDILILELGINDILNGIKPQEIKANLKKIIEKVKAKYPDCVVILSGLIISSDNVSENFRDFDRIYPELSQELDLPLVPSFLNGVWRNSDLNLPDGLHPTREGTKLVFENVWIVLDSVLTK